MNIKIIKNTQYYNGTLLDTNTVLESKYSKSQFNGISLVKYFIYDLETNSREEILPKIKKYNIISIKDATWNTRFVYFTNCNLLEHDKVQFLIYRYDYQTKENDIIYSFIDDIDLFPFDKQIKIYVLNDSYLIFQTAYLKANQSESFEDFLDFEMFLYSIKENKEINIIDENLTNNGIDAIVPISETHSVLKTGYSLLDNARYQYLDRDDVCVEGISIINIQQLISDLFLVNNNIVIDTIDQAFFNKTFPYVTVEGEYLIYSAVNFETHEEEIFFYHYVTKEIKSCINQNVYTSTDLAKPYIIDNIPYIRLNTQKGTEFFNLVRAKIDVRFESDVTVKDVKNNIFIISGVTKRKLFNKYRPYLSIVKYPQMNLLHQEKANYLGCVYTDEDNIQIFVK